jgi:NitT/TauT family transport system ATP-binding protein
MSNTAINTNQTTGQADLGHLSVQDVGKVYDPGGANVVALDGCSLEIPSGDFIAVVGPSGCGKSTLLNILAGFDNLTAGRVLLDDEPLATLDMSLRPGPDRVVVFQNGALFPWKTVLQNVVYSLVVQKRMSVQAANEKGMELLSRTGNLDRIAHSFPGQLSSGMQRRVEILRALINNPKILLLDEPFRAMDTVSKTTMHRHLLDIYDQYHKTVFFITHDLDEAIFLADSVVVMTTRPGTIKLRLDVDLPRPRTRETIISQRFLELKQQAVSAVHEEAKKAFERGERELA